MKYNLLTLFHHFKGTTFLQLGLSWHMSYLASFSEFPGVSDYLITTSWFIPKSHLIPKWHAALFWITYPNSVSHLSVLDFLVLSPIHHPYSHFYTTK